MALGKKRTEEDPQIDLTPMLDVIFIMLIFFVITASFVKESGIDVNRPPITTKPPENSANRPIIFNITESNDIWLEGRRIDVRAPYEQMWKEHMPKTPKRRSLLRLTQNLRPIPLYWCLIRLEKPE